MEIVIRITVPEGVTVQVDQIPSALPYHPVLEEAPWPVPVLQDTVAPQAPQSNGAPVTSQITCPDHRTPMTFKPAGISKRTGKPYSSFYACSTPDCKRTYNP